MPRPTKKRNIGNIPKIKYFKPQGVCKKELKEMDLTLEEIEAIRLKDLKKLDQQECADRMEVSRTTFQRILKTGRNKIAEALIKGKAIRFKGGNYKLKKGRYRCRKCNHELNYNCSAKRHRKRHGKRKNKDNESPRCPECGGKSFQLLKNKS